MREPKISPLKLCDYCHNGIGITTYACHAVLAGEYCTSDCYANALEEKYHFGGLKGRFGIKGDGHGGVELVPIWGY